MKIHDHSTIFLRRSLMGNAAFSFVSGLVFVIGHQSIALFAGLSQSQIVLGVGVSLLVFSLGLFRNGVRDTVSAFEAGVAVILDLAWIAASVLIITFGLLSTGGNWALVAIADIVLAFAVLQYLGLRQLRNTNRELNPAPSDA